jgi:hypothetical protein
MKRTIMYVVIGCAIGLLASANEATGLYVPQSFKAAYSKGTRSPDGTPGPDYWQNRADYSLDIEVDPQSLTLIGRGKITYFNNSPDELTELVLHLFANLYAAGAARDYDVDQTDLTEGMLINEISVSGSVIDTSPESTAVRVEHTLMTIMLDQPLRPGASLELSISWQTMLNRSSHLRDGAVDATSLFAAYFFPRIAVYDDIQGWNRSRYLGTAELYNDFGDFEVDITVPDPYIVWATGALRNPQEMLAPAVLERYRLAHTIDTVVHVVDAEDRAGHGATRPGPTHTWSFAATDVSDFAFATSDHYLWDATSVEVDPGSGRRVRLDAAYPVGSSDFDTVAGVAREAVHYMSYEFPGVAFPYPELTVFQGLADMEYPMMVNDSSSDTPELTLQLTSHEIFHTYFPFLTGMNETRYAWMDEGLACLADYLLMEHQGVPRHTLFWFFDLYRDEIGHDIDSPIFVRSDMLREPAYYNSSYTKAAVFFLILRDLLGEEVFTTAIQTFIERWQGKHPIPHDLFGTFEAVAGQDLDWIIRPWFYEYGMVDLAIVGVSSQNGSSRVVIERKGSYPASIHLKLTYANGLTESVNRSAEVWRNGETTCTIEHPGRQPIVKVELADEVLLDASTIDNTWSSKEGRD